MSARRAAGWSASIWQGRCTRRCLRHRWGHQDAPGEGATTHQDAPGEGATTSDAAYDRYGRHLVMRGYQNGQVMTSFVSFVLLHRMTPKRPTTRPAPQQPHEDTCMRAKSTVERNAAYERMYRDCTT